MCVTKSSVLTGKTPRMHGFCPLGLVSVLVVLILLQFPRMTTGQFPRVCIQNATKTNATCCPTPPGLQMPCGGPGRGICLPFSDVHEVFWPPVDGIRPDDRLNWPTRFFRYACACDGNFAGYMCQDCKFGYRGPNCTDRRPLVRKNLLSLSEEEQTRFVRLLDKSKNTLSEYMVLKIGQMDPIRDPKWVNVTVYNFFIFIHYYASRSTYVNASALCRPDAEYTDFAHLGPGFPTFHRLLLLVWEREFQKLAADDTFTFPYWDWSRDGSTCSVCTNRLLGGIHRDLIHPGSVFSKWRTICHLGGIKQCRICDPTEDMGPILRRPSREFPSLPDVEDIHRTLNLRSYDKPPYDGKSPPTSFRNCFEGNCPVKHVNFSMHNLVHAFFNGTMSDVSTSTNDPLFIVHHAFLDRLLEIWLRRNHPHVTQLPGQGAPLGHNRDAVMVPFFPRFFHHWMLTHSHALGYTYDNFNIGDLHKPPQGWSATPLSSLLTSCLTVCLFLTIFFLGLVVHERTQRAPPTAEHLLNCSGDACCPDTDGDTSGNEDEEDDVVFGRDRKLAQENQALITASEGHKSVL